MRLLILTQKVDQNDDVLGFFHGWIEEFSKHLEGVTVIALGVGEYHLPENVRVLSLGKDRGVSRLGYIFNFYRFIWRERKNYDAVFVHMNPLYVILGGSLWRALGKKIGLWYVHKNVDTKLRVAEKLSHTIFTASRTSFRLRSKKIHIVGHGIDTMIYNSVKKAPDTMFRVLTVGRIAPIKDYQTLIDTAAILVKEIPNLRVDIVGGPLTDGDKDYAASLYELVREKHLNDVVHFVGSVPNKKIIQYLAQADIFVNMSNTGSLDKAALEAMASGVPVVTSNEAIREVLGSDAETLVFAPGSAHECAQCVKGVYDFPISEREALGVRLRMVVEKAHNIKVLIPRIVSYYEASR